MTDRHADCADECQTAAARGAHLRCDHRECDLLACERWDAERMGTGFSEALSLTERAVADFHDDRQDGRPDLHISTERGDLDIAGRPLRPGK